MTISLKTVPEDFRVREITSRPVRPDGRISLYRLQKRHLGTHEACELIRRSWNLSMKQFSWCGLKDRRAVTEQLIGIARGPREDLEGEGFELRYIGAATARLSSDDILANHFRLRVRGVAPADHELLTERVKVAAERGIPNYFDSQRFGSVTEAGEFPAVPWCLGDEERAVRLLLAEPCSGDSMAERAQKEIVAQHWGQWPEAKALLTRSNRRSVVTYLVDHPEGYRKALGLIDPRRRGLCLSALQSGVWNRMLSLMLLSWLAEPETPPGRLATLSIAGSPLYFPRGETADRSGADVQSKGGVPPDDSRWCGTRVNAWAGVGDAASSSVDVPGPWNRLALPSARWKPETEEQHRLVAAALGPFGLLREQMRVRAPRDCFFSKAERAAFLYPKGLRSQWFDADEHGDGGIELSFELPAGAYATLVVRFLLGDDLN